jgi:hypothetical protein
MNRCLIVLAIAVAIYPTLEVIPSHDEIGELQHMRERGL